MTDKPQSLSQEKIPEGMYRIKLNGKGTGIQLNKLVDADTARRIINIMMSEDSYVK